MEKNIMKLTGWVARDEDGTLFFYSKEPKKSFRNWVLLGNAALFLISKEDDIFGDKVKWEDEKPLLVKFGCEIYF